MWCVGLWDLCGYWTPPSSSLPSFELTVLNECAERALRQLAIQGNLEPGKICFFERELCVMCAVSHSVWLVCESEFCHEQVMKHDRVYLILSLVCARGRD